MFRSVAVVMRGTVIAQIIGATILPLLSRRFAAEAFGHFQVFQYSLSLLLVIATLRYEIALLRARTAEDFSALLILCFCINVGLGGLMILLWLIHGIGHDATASFGFSPAFLIVGFVIGGFVQFLGYAMVRDEAFSEQSNAKVVQALANAGSATGIALVGPIGSGIIIADVVGRIAAAAMMLVSSARRLRSTLIWPSRGAVGRVARLYSEYPLIATPGGLINMAGSALTPLLLYSSFDAATSGQFGLVERSMALPIGLLVASLSQVYMGALATDIRERPAAAMARYLRLIGLLTIVSVPPAVVFVMFSTDIFHIVFGPGWEQASVFAEIMAPAYCMAIIMGSINMTLIVIGRQRLQIAWEIGRLAAMATLWTQGPRLGWSAETMVLGHSVVLTLFSVIMIVLAGVAIRGAVMGALSVASLEEKVLR